MSWVKSAEALQATEKDMEEVIKALMRATMTQQQTSVEANCCHEEAMAQQQALAQAVAAQQENTCWLSSLQPSSKPHKHK